jgi:16S rRNA processing protein RimM
LLLDTWRAEHKSAEMVKEGLVLVGKITAPHGVRGQVRVMSYTQAPEDIVRFSALYSADGQRIFRIKQRAEVRGQLVVDVEGCASRNDAELLRNVVLYAKREEFPALNENDDFYLSDLIGLEVRSEGGEKIGTVRDAHNFGGGDILEILPLQGAAFMVLFTKENFPNVALEQGFLTFCPPEVLDASKEA